MAVEIVKSDAGETGYRVLVGGGMGRTPYIGYVVGDFVAQARICWRSWKRCCAFITSTGRRDNIYKARIKILATALGAEEMRTRVEREFAEIKQSGHAGRCRPKNWRASRPILRRRNSRRL